MIDAREVADAARQLRLAQRELRAFAELIIKKLVALRAQVHNLLAVGQPCGNLFEDFVTDGCGDLVPEQRISVYDETIRILRTWSDYLDSGSSCLVHLVSLVRGGPFAVLHGGVSTMPDTATALERERGFCLPTTAAEAAMVTVAIFGMRKK